MKVPFISLSDVEESNSPKAIRARRESLSQVFEPKPPATSPRSPRSRANVSDAKKDANQLFPPNYYFVPDKNVIVREPYLVSRFEIQSRYSPDVKIVKLKASSHQQMEHIQAKTSFVIDSDGKDEKVFCLIGDDTVVDYSSALEGMDITFLTLEQSEYANGVGQPVVHQEVVSLTPVDKATMFLQETDHALTKWITLVPQKPAVPSVVYRCFDMSDKQGIPLIHTITSAFLTSDYIKKNPDEAPQIIKLHSVLQDHLKILEQTVDAFHKLTISDEKYTHDRTFILEFKNSMVIISQLVHQISFQ